jgi:hypothetical protein
MSKVNAQSKKAEILDYVKQLEEKLERTEVPVTDEDSLVQELLEQNQRLVAALQAERVAQGLAAQKPDEDAYTVENVSGMNVHIVVKDHRGVEIRRVFRGKGAKHALSEEQVEELENTRPELFEKGILSIPGRIKESPNVIRDIDAFIETIDLETAREQLKAITSVHLLYKMFDFIETKRYLHADENGQPLKETVNGVTSPILREVELPYRYKALEAAVQERLFDLTGEQLQITPDE